MSDKGREGQSSSPPSGGSAADREASSKHPQPKNDSVDADGSALAKAEGKLQVEQDARNDKMRQHARDAGSDTGQPGDGSNPDG